MDPTQNLLSLCELLISKVQRREEACSLAVTEPYEQQHVNILHNVLTTLQIAKLQLSTAVATPFNPKHPDS